MSIIQLRQALDLATRGDTVIIDARGGADALARFENGHLDGALFVDLETDLSDKSISAEEGGRHPLPSVQDFGRFLGTLGIKPETSVLIYDDKKGAMAAARFWWMLKAVGHDQAFVISGGLDALVASEIPLSTDTLTLVSETEDYPVSEWIWPTVTSEEVAAAAADEDYVVIDVRENFRYRGDSEPIDLVAGHIPGAINIPYIENMGSDGQFLSVEELTQKYETALGDKDPANIVVHCGSGVTACHTLLALEEAGISGASLYVGSWSEWSRNDRPIAKDSE